MKIVDTIVKKADTFQQKHTVFGLPFAIFKSYSDSNTGYQAALITYYGFLSLFPLLLFTTSLVSIIVSNNQELESKIMTSISSYFPAIGQQLAENINSTSASGVALVISMIIALYGARGGADSFRVAINHVWKIPKNKQPHFPESFLTSIAMVLIGGVGLYSAAILSTYAAGLGDILFFKLLSILSSLLLLVPTLYFLFTASLGIYYATHKDKMIMAISSSLGILIIQAFGGYLVTNQLNKMSPIYGTFTLVLGLLFWIYLQATIVLYAAQTRYIRKHNLWPRSLNGKQPTTADRSKAHHSL